MPRRLIKLIDKLPPLRVVVICAALVLAPDPVTFLLQVSLAGDQFELQEDDEVSVEEQFEAVLIVPRKRLPNELVRQTDGSIAKLLGQRCGSGSCGPRSVNQTAAVSELVHHNGCGANLRC